MTGDGDGDGDGGKADIYARYICSIYIETGIGLPVTIVRRQLIFIDP